MENVIREKLAERAKNIRLYLHAYAGNGANLLI